VELPPAARAHLSAERPARPDERGDPAGEHAGPGRESSVRTGEGREDVDQAETKERVIEQHETVSGDEANSERADVLVHREDAGTAQEAGAGFGAHEEPGDDGDGEERERDDAGCAADHPGGRAERASERPAGGNRDGGNAEGDEDVPRVHYEPFDFFATATRGAGVFVATAVVVVLVAAVREADDDAAVEAACDAAALVVEAPAVADADAGWFK
jgi:hypothetical protein